MTTIYSLGRNSITDLGSVNVFQVLWNVVYDNLTQEGAGERLAQKTAKSPVFTYKLNAWAAGYDKSVCRLQGDLPNPAALLPRK